MKIVVSYLNFVFHIEVKTKSKYKSLNFNFKFIKRTKAVINGRYVFFENTVFNNFSFFPKFVHHILIESDFPIKDAVKRT